MAARFETDLWRSTYRQDFNPSPTSFLPPLKYFQEPCLTPQKGKLSPRVFPISLPRFPHRRRDGEIPMAVGFATLPHRQDQVSQGIRNKAAGTPPPALARTNARHELLNPSSRGVCGKPVRCSPTTAHFRPTPYTRATLKTSSGDAGTPTRTNCQVASMDGAGTTSITAVVGTPAVTNNNTPEPERPINEPSEIPDQVFEEIMKLSIYTPSSHLSDLHPLPPSRRSARRISAKFLDSAPRERHPDTVRNRAHVYEDHPSVWQRVGPVWDKVQNRPGCDEKTENETLQTTVYEMDRNRIQPFVVPDYAQHKSHARLLNREQVRRKPADVSKAHQDSAKIREEQLSRIPGYGGYMPRLPHTETSEADRNVGPTMKSMAQLTFRNLSSKCYKPPSHGHLGPLSKTVTLTQPFNPFNKIDQHEITCC